MKEVNIKYSKYIINVLFSTYKQRIRKRGISNGVYNTCKNEEVFSLV